MSAQRRPNFFAKYRPKGAADDPKYIVLRKAMIAAIEDGYWKSGDKLPTEHEFTALTPYSLGTVQRAIQTLVGDGFAFRKPRSGSFVATRRKRIGGPWLFRFLSDDGTRFLPMFTRVVDRRTITEPGPWSRWLGNSNIAKPLLRIDRQIQIENDLVAFNRVYLDAGLFSVIATAPVHQLDGVNFVELIQNVYHLPVNRIAHTVRCAKFPEAVCRDARWVRGTLGLVVEILASAGCSHPISYQKIFLPPHSPRLYISESDADWDSMEPEIEAGRAPMPVDEGVEGNVPTGPPEISHRPKGQQRGDEAPEPEAEQVSRRMELRHQPER